MTASLNAIVTIVFVILKNFMKNLGVNGITILIN